MSEQLAERIRSILGPYNDDTDSLQNLVSNIVVQLDELKAAQAQASKPIAAVHGWFHGECVIRALDPEAVLPAGMALYSQPQAQAVNQQLLEALQATLQTVEDYTILIHEEWGDCRTLEKIEADGELHKSVLIARAAIAAAQQRHGAGE